MTHRPLADPMSGPLASARVTSRTQITIPKKVAALLGIEPGDLLLFHAEGRRVYVEAGAVVTKPRR